MCVHRSTCVRVCLHVTDNPIFIYDTSALPAKSNKRSARTTKSADISGRRKRRQLPRCGKLRYQLSVFDSAQFRPLGIRAPRFPTLRRRKIRLARWEGGGGQRTIQIMICRVIHDEPHYSSPRSSPRPIGTLSRASSLQQRGVPIDPVRYRANLSCNVGSFRVNFPAIKTGNVRNCGEIAAYLPPPLSPPFAEISTRSEHAAFIIDRVTSTSTLNQVTSRRISGAFRSLPNYA